jgi:hypothetical protein
MQEKKREGVKETALDLVVQHNVRRKKEEPGGVDDTADCQLLHCNITSDVTIRQDGLTVKGRFACFQHGLLHCNITSNLTTEE